MKREILLSTLTKYFTTLSQKGFSSLSRSEDMLILSYLEELLYSDYFIHITSEEYIAIEELLELLAGEECYIPYSLIEEYHTNNNSKNATIIKAPVLRVTQESGLRSSSYILRSI